MLLGEYVLVRYVFSFVKSDSVGECEADGWIMEGLPLKKLDLPCPFLPIMRLICELRLLTTCFSYDLKF